MPDEMPAQRKIAGLSHLSLRFLHLVLAEIDLAGQSGRADIVGGEGLGDGEEANRGGIAPGPESGARDAIANTVQPGTERRIVHYFFSWATSPLAVAAFGPSGDSLRYVSNSL